MGAVTENAWLQAEAGSLKNYNRTNRNFQTKRQILRNQDVSQNQRIEIPIQLT